MNVVTFGSCLSRYTANCFVRLFNGNILSCVFHNRSDTFVQRYIDKTLPILNPTDCNSYLCKAEDEDGKSIEDKTSIIINNQMPETMGLHRLSKGIPLLNCIEQEKIDLFIIDNYMDLAAKLIYIDGDNKKPLFIRLNNRDNTQISDFLSPQDSVINFKKIISFLSKKQPNAKFAFINFPHSTYAENIDRVKRTTDFEELFNTEKAFIIKCLTIHKSYQTQDKQHFLPPQYAGYAGMIYQKLFD